MKKKKKKKHRPSNLLASSIDAIDESDDEPSSIQPLKLRIQPTVLEDKDSIEESDLSVIDDHLSLSADEDIPADPHSIDLGSIAGDEHDDLLDSTLKASDVMTASDNGPTVESLSQHTLN